MSGVRSFVALELPPHVVDTLLGAGAALREVDSPWRDEKWVAENNLHITLKFLGNLADCALDDLRTRLDADLAGQDTFEIALSACKAMRSARRCSMVWAQFADTRSGQCASLAATVDLASASIGVERDSRRFSPHVTLVRARRPRHLDPEALTCANASLQHADRSMSVLSATLFASTLTRQGPVYEKFAEWTFAPGR